MRHVPSILLVAFASLLPVLSARRTRVRAALGIIGAVNLVTLVAIDAYGESLSGLGGLRMLGPMLVSWGVAAVLFVVGVALLLTRLARRRFAAFPGWFAPVFGWALVAILLIGLWAVAAPSGCRATQERNAKRYRAIEAARDGASYQTKDELLQRATQAVASSDGSTSEGRETVATRLVALLHPGVSTSAQYFHQSSSCGEWVPQEDDRTHQLVSQSLLNAYGGASQKLTPPVVTPVTNVTSQWGDEVTIEEIPRKAESSYLGYRELLSFWDEERTVNTKPVTYRDGRLLFPSGRYFRLHVYSDGRPFLTLYAVQDGEKWWLVGMSP